MTRLSPYFHVRVIYFKWCKTLGLYEAHQRGDTWVVCDWCGLAITFAHAHCNTQRRWDDVTRRQPDRAAAKSRRVWVSYPANIIRPNPDNTPIQYFGLLAFLFAAYLDLLRPMWSSLSFDELIRSAFCNFCSTIKKRT